MADIEKMVPFILKWETSTIAREGESNRSLFERAKKTGYACDPSDRGGATMCGITIGTYRQWHRSRGLPEPSVADLRAISYEEWLQIMKSLFWDKWLADEIRNQKVAEHLVDWAWMSGLSTVKRAQRMLGVKADGKVGTVTIEAVNACDDFDGSLSLLAKLKAARIAHIEEICRTRPQNMKFRTGWLRRIAAI